MLVQLCDYIIASFHQIIHTHEALRVLHQCVHTVHPFGISVLEVLDIQAALQVEHKARTGKQHGMLL